MILDFDILAWVIGIVALLVVLIVLRKREKSLSYLFFFSAFWIYLLLVLKLEIFPIPIAKFDGQDTQELLSSMLSSINLKPFYFGHFITIQDIFITIIQYLIFAAPFGFGLSFIASFNPKDFLWLSILFGVGIEIAQFIISLVAVFLGVWSAEHMVDITDVILNIFGVLLGYGLFRVFAIWYKSLQWSLKSKGIFAYIQDVANRA
jgi:glycopeptide antibiotics resistance protein